MNEEVDVVGIHRGDSANFAASTSGASDDSIAAFTGSLRDGTLQTVWFVVANGIKVGDHLAKRSWAHAVTANRANHVSILSKSKTAGAF